MKIGILQTGRSPEHLRVKHGDYNDMFINLLAGRGFEFVTYPVLDGVFPDSAREADGWLISGSKFSAYDEFDWIERLQSFLRQAYEKKIPIIGICFGHQILAQALGGRVEKYSKGWSAGIKEYADFKGQNVFKIPAWHQDQVVELPKGAKVIASSDFCPYAMLEYGDRALSLQPHPEFSIGFLADLIEARKDILPANITKEAKREVALTFAGRGAEDEQKLEAKRLAYKFEEFFKRPRNNKTRNREDQQGQL